MSDPRMIRKWLRDNGNQNTNPASAHQMCNLMRMSFPDLQIVRGVVFYDFEDKERINFPGKHVWCQCPIEKSIYDVSYEWFDKVHKYKDFEVIQEAQFR